MREYASVILLVFICIFYVASTPFAQDVPPDEEIPVLTEPSSVTPSANLFSEEAMRTKVEGSIHVLDLDTRILKRKEALRYIKIWINYKLGYIAFKVTHFRISKVTGNIFYYYKINSINNIFRGHITYSLSDDTAIITAAASSVQNYKIRYLHNHYISYKIKNIIPDLSNDQVKIH